MFDLDQFIADCNAAVRSDRSHKLVREVVARAVSDPTAVVAGLGEPCRAEVRRLYSSAELTILNVVWGPLMTIMPHNHQMWAVIGVYAGREDNILWRTLASRRVEAAGAKTLGQGDTVAFGPEVIHSVINPLTRLTSALHVYGGDFFSPSAAANGIRRHSSNGTTTWRKICACSRLRTGPTPIRDLTRRLAAGSSS